MKTTNSPETLLRRAVPRPEVVDSLFRWAASLNGSDKNRACALRYVGATIGPLISAPSSDGPDELDIEVLIEIRRSLYRRYSRLTARSHFSRLLSAVRHIADEELIALRQELPSVDVTEIELSSFAETENPPPLEGIAYPTNMSERGLSQWESIDKYSPTEDIAIRLREHIESKAIVKHHRGRIAVVLELLFNANSKWHERPDVIHHVLKSFRNGLLDLMARNTAYFAYSTIVKAFTVLAEHQLIPSSTVIPKNLKRDKSGIFQRVNNPTLGTINIYEHDSDRVSESTADYIAAYSTDVSRTLELILETAREVVHKGYQKYLEGQQLAMASDFNAFIDTPLMKVALASSGGAKPICVSAFSTKCPNRIANALALLKLRHGGIYKRSAFKLAHCPPLYELENFLGLTLRVIAAMQAIIVNECGINPYSLYNLKVTDVHHFGELVKATEEGDVRMNAVKWRARRLQRRLVTGQNKILSDLTSKEITASSCLRMALEMSAELRASTRSEYLWTCHLKGDPGHPSPETHQSSFKNVFGAIDDHANGPTLMKLRVSRAVVTYIDTKGDIVQVARYLGNKVSTTIEQYIPMFLQQAIYRKKIAGFQSLLLVLSTADHDPPHIPLNLSPEEYINHVQALFKNTDFEGTLIQVLTRHDDPTSRPLYRFILSEQTLALALRYVSEGDDSELVSMCEAALEKAAAGPVHVKQMLRRAKLAVHSVPQ